MNEDLAADTYVVVKKHYNVGWPCASHYQYINADQVADTNTCGG